MRLAKMVLGFALGLAIGLLIGYGFLFLYANHQMERRGFASFETVMKEAGYTLEKAEGVERICRNTERELILTVEKGCETVVINKNTYSSKGNFLRTLNTLYVKVDFLESLLQVDVKRKKGRIPWTYIYRVIYDSSSVGKNPQEEESGESQTDASQNASEETAAQETEYEEAGAKSTNRSRVLSSVEKLLDNSLVAHAGGGFLLANIDGTNYMLNYTNTRESVLHSIRNGFTMIEMDFAYAGDGVLCAVHKWPDKAQKKDSNLFLETQEAGGLTRMSMEDTLKLLVENPNVCIILDLRLSDDSEEYFESCYGGIVSMALEIGGDTLAKRIIPQIYHTWQYDVIKSVYSWGSIIFTMYKEPEMTAEELVDFVRAKRDIWIVTIPKSVLTEDMIQALHGVGKKVFTHTLNGLSSMNSWRKKGVDGFYTDIVTPQMFYERFSTY